MNWFIDRSSNTPPYLQLLGQVKEGIRVGHFDVDEALPSVREIAERSGASLSTIQKVLHELKREGLVYARSGKGVFVAPNADKFTNKIVVFIPSAELSFYAEYSGASIPQPIRPHSRFRSTASIPRLRGA
jgi:DNA-binding transcriptional regulator YhcF (GntR family)